MFYISVFTISNGSITVFRLSILRFRFHSFRNDFKWIDLVKYTILLDQAYLFVMSPPDSDSFIYLAIHGVDLQTKGSSLVEMPDFMNSTNR